MRLLFLALFGYSVTVSLGSIPALWPDRHADPVTFWFLTALAAVAALVDGVLFLAVLFSFVSPWWFAAVVGVQDAVYTWRLLLVLRIRQRSRVAYDESGQE